MQLGRKGQLLCGEKGELSRPSRFGSKRIIKYLFISLQLSGCEVGAPKETHGKTVFVLFSRKHTRAPLTNALRSWPYAAEFVVEATSPSEVLSAK
mmetsp:Transcript_10953/g.33768  ORF Transcript_10953/g.33768 Transcript_10953/m.33768 type:complete len:95 (-) Transcript_10953:1455-1739(-)